MSKGPGRIERAIAGIMDADPDNAAYTIEELCEQIYLVPAGKRHRVAVIRAAKNLAARRADIRWWTGERRGQTLIFHRIDNYSASALANVKVWCYHLHEARERADDLMAENNPHHYWRRCVDRFLAELDGDTARIAELDALTAAINKAYGFKSSPVMTSE